MSSRLLKLIEVDPVTHVETISDPRDFRPDTVLQAIEETPDSFTEGRRNNDIVNWFIAKRLVEMDGEPEDVARPVDEYIEEFQQMMCGLTDAQQDALNHWNESYSYKIERLHLAYGGIAEAKRLAWLWLPLNYNVPG